MDVISLRHVRIVGFVLDCVGCTVRNLIFLPIEWKNGFPFTKKKSTQRVTVLWNFAIDARSGIRTIIGTCLGGLRTCFPLMEARSGPYMKAACLASAMVTGQLMIWGLDNVLSQKWIVTVYQFFS